MSSPLTFDDDLFQPSLSEADDAGQFDRPWNPTHWVFVGFFFGILAGGIPLLLNFRRLGLPKRTTPNLILVVLVTVALYTFAAWVATSPWYDKDDSVHRNKMRLARRVVVVVTLLALAVQQRRRYRLFQFTDKPKGKLLQPIIVFAALSTIADIAGVSLAVFVFLR